MKKSEVKNEVIAWVKRNKINTASITMGDDSGDTHFGTSDLTCREGEVMQCQALTSEGEVIEFEILAHGVEFDMIGEMSGAF